MPISTSTAADLALRQATLDDAAFAADVETAVNPDDPDDPVLRRHGWQYDDLSSVTERFVAELGARPAGYARRSHPSWERVPERFDSLHAELLPELRTPARLGALLSFLEERSRADGARTFTVWTWEHDATRVEVLRFRGYREERRERFWELDLVAKRERLLAMAEASRARMRDQGIRILTLAQDTDPDRLHKLLRMSNEAEQDAPTTAPHVLLSLEELRTWFASPGLREDRTWIAREGEDVVGLSMLTYPPTRGVVSTDWTATARSVRGRGVARALKCETLAEAIALGVTRVRTDNDSTNAPILHINADMGYVRRPDKIQFHKPASA